MTSFQGLLDQQLPNVVQRVPLGEIGEFVRGGGFSKADLTENGRPAIHYGQIYTAFRISTDIALSRVSDDVAISAQIAKPGDLLIAISDVTPTNVGRAVVWLGETEVSIGGDILAFRHNLNPKYVAYFFDSKDFALQKAPLVTGATIRHLSAKTLSKIRVPVPPVEIQNEIVRILDAFTELEAWLECELKARIKQFEHIRKDLLSQVAKDAKIKPLGEIADLNWGDTSKTKSSYVNEGEKFRAFSASGPDGFLPTYDYDRQAVVLSAIGALAGKTWRTTGKWSCIKNTIRFFSTDELIVSDDFLYWWTSTPNFWPRRGAAQPFITKGDADKIPVPVPSIEEQDRISAILNNFAELVGDSDASLPAELAARRKQYEHCRDQLLTFTEQSI